MRLIGKNVRTARSGASRTLYGVFPTTLRVFLGLNKNLWLSSRIGVVEYASLCGLSKPGFDATFRTLERDGEVYSKTRWRFVGVCGGVDIDGMADPFEDVEV